MSWLIGANKVREAVKVISNRRKIICLSVDMTIGFGRYIDNGI